MGYMLSGDEDQAMDLFDRMEKDGNIKRDTASWNSLIAGYLQNGQKNKALEIFRKMQSLFVRPNSVTILSLLPACENLVAAKKVKEIHGCVLRRNLESDLSVANSLIDSYAKSGNIIHSRNIFDRMSTKDIITWNTLIAGFVLHGCSLAALDLFDQMKKAGFKPNRGTFVSIISAWGLAGMVDEGKRVFSSMIEDYYVLPCMEHCLAMVNLLGRSGRLEEAIEFVENMPIEPDFSVWSALLTAGRFHGNSRLAVYAWGKITSIKTRECLHSAGNETKESTGWSWIEVKNMVHDFVAGDQSKPNSGILYSWIRSIAGQIWGPDPHDGLCIEEEEKEEICGNMVDYGKSTMAVGPWGGQDGFRWDDGVYSGVRQLVIAHGAGIDSIRIEYDDRGFSVWSEKHGGSGGLKIDKVKLEYPDEFLTSIHGYYGCINEWGSEFVRSLTFESNKKTYGPYGIEDGTYFSFPMIGGKIIGFYGRGGWYLDAIGAYLEPFGLRPNLPKSLVQPRYAANGTEKFGYSVVQGNLESNYDIVLAFRQKNEYNCQYPPDDLSRQTSSSQDFSDTESKDKMSSVHSFPSSIERVPSKREKGNVSYGAWGGSGGTVFDDGVYMGVRQIHLSRNVGIVSIRVLYELNGEAIWGTKNGGTGGFKSDKIIFDYPYEILTRITGFYGPAMLMGPTVIKSLTFYTTKTKHGPFGEEQGQEFTTNAREGKIVGFHGRKGMFLDAIGVHVVEGKVMPPIRPPPNSSIQGEVVEGKTTRPIRRPFNSSIQGEVVEGKPTPPIRPLFNSSIQGDVVEGKPILPIRPPFNSSIQGEGPTTELDKPHWSNKLTLPWRGSSTDEVLHKSISSKAS
ncbi:hypothetical protein HYC85_008616 [Camellia sinensis]|uniref:Jacalin-type lectin domain-containing protein n=1 Tax=Camellia sinensis TaxID=4442 RepID=A0A7J7HSB3_CAMSI|nr:hypothetical protein HYC85_008616 [Camellia sinensis]